MTLEDELAKIAKQLNDAGLLPYGLDRSPGVAPARDRGVAQGPHDGHQDGHHHLYMAYKDEGSEDTSDTAVNPKSNEGPGLALFAGDIYLYQSTFAPEQL